MKKNKNKNKNKKKKKKKKKKKRKGKGYTSRRGGSEGSLEVGVPRAGLSACHTTCRPRYSSKQKVLVLS